MTSVFDFHKDLIIDREIIGFLVDIDLASECSRRICIANNNNSLRDFFAWTHYSTIIMSLFT